MTDKPQTTLNYIALKAAQKAFDDAISSVQGYMKRCAELCHKDAKLSDSAKAYFEAQEAEAIEAIRQLKEMRPHD